jgi:hypothetical protein
MSALIHDELLSETEAALRELFRPLPLLPPDERGQNCVGCEEAIFAEIDEDELIWRGMVAADGKFGAHPLRERVSGVCNGNFGDDAPSMCVEGCARCERRGIVAECFFERASERRHRLDKALSVTGSGSEEDEDVTSFLGGFHSKFSALLLDPLDTFTEPEAPVESGAEDAT